MIKDIHILSRRTIEKALDTGTSPAVGDWFLISIYDLKDERLLTDKNRHILSRIGCKRYIASRFYDFVEYNCELETEIDDYKIFDENDAGEIIRFLDEIRHKDGDLVMHCTAGVSRSGAVGVFACEYLGLDFDKFIRRHSLTIYPNRLVVDTLEKVSGFNLKKWGIIKEKFYKNHQFGTIF